MAKKYFGTDGVRGRVGEDLFTPEFVMRLGWAAGRVLGKQGRGKVVIGKDTRISGYMFESALEAGLSAAGMDVFLLGPMPTPAIAYLTRTLHAEAGVVISASHNPFYDNGIKFFSSQGGKLSDELEYAIEEELEKPMETVDSLHLGKAARIDDAGGRYIEFCKASVPFGIDLKGLKIVVDCANGATYHVAPPVFRELGAEVIPLGNTPDGFNINEKCGSTHTENLRSEVKAKGADLGVALDGDGDRLIMVDADGEEVDGDELLYIIACARKRKGEMVGSVVGTLMSNLGLEVALREQGLGLERVPVGDRYVMQRLKEQQWILGGESSGHIICLDRTTTGDGIVAALQVLAEIVETGKSLAELRSGMQKYPQRMINVAIKEKVDPFSSDKVKQAVEAAEERLADKGRVLLRASGTEPLIRVMVEGMESELVNNVARQLAEVVAEAYSGQLK